MTEPVDTITLNGKTMPIEEAGINDSTDEEFYEITVYVRKAVMDDAELS